MSEPAGADDYRATFMKLKDGSWGVRVESEVAPLGTLSGQSMTISRKDSSTTVEELGRCVWVSPDNDYAIYALRKTERRNAPLGEEEDFKNELYAVELFVERMIEQTPDGWERRWAWFLTSRLAFVVERTWDLIDYLQEIDWNKHEDIPEYTRKAFLEVRRQLNGLTDPELGGSTAQVPEGVDWRPPEGEVLPVFKMEEDAQ